LAEDSALQQTTQVKVVRILASKINSLGDAVCFLPTLHGIREQLPEAQMSVLCTPVGLEVFEKSIRDVHFVSVEASQAFGWRALLSLWPVRREFRRHRYSLMLFSYDEPTFSYLLGLSLGIPERTGFSAGIARGQCLLTNKLPFDPSRNVVDINFDLVRNLMGSAALKPKRVPIWYSDRDRNIVLQRLKGCGVSDGSKFIAIHPGARLPYKQWGLDNFVGLAKFVSDQSGFPTVLISQSSETFPDEQRTVSVLTVKQLACLLGAATLFIGNNSGPMHVAHSMQTPCVIVEGPTPKAWSTFWPDVPSVNIKASELDCVPCEQLGRKIGVCLNTAHPVQCMKSIKIKTVAQEVLTLLERMELL
jgi:ADP-heptose:LPS heptosyltransferase